MIGKGTELRQFRRALLPAALLAMTALALLCMLGAFLGPARGKAFFNSAPLAVFWLLLVFLLGLGLFTFKRLPRSTGLIALHLGPLLILLGSLWGSEGGHRLAERLTGRAKIPAGHMVIPEGGTSNTVLSDTWHELGSLPFSLKLKDFRIERYEPIDESWQLVLVSGFPGSRRGLPIEWEVGRQTKVPGTDVLLTVIKYLESARPLYTAGAEPDLEIAFPNGEVRALPARKGEETRFADAGLSVRIAEVLPHADGTGGDGRIEAPVLKVVMSKPGADAVVRYVLPDWPVHLPSLGGLTLSCVPPEPADVVQDPASGLPAMALLLRGEHGERHTWLLPVAGADFARMSLAPVTPISPAPVLDLLKPIRPVKDYVSEVAVIRDGEVVAEKAIEVNKPLHYGGYHFHQHSYDPQNLGYTNLSLTSDSGLAVVGVGFLLVIVGAFWWCWLGPVAGYLRTRR